LQLGAVRRVHLTFTSEFSEEIHMLESMPKLWESTMEIRQIPVGVTGVSKPTGP
jgi:hypothetical protein